MDGFHTPLRSDATDEMFRHIQSRRDDAELNNPNYCKKIILDAAGEWSTKNERFMAQARDKGIQVVNPPSHSDKRLTARAEGAIGRLKRRVQA